MSEKMIYLPKELLARDLTGAELAIYAVLTSCGKKWVRIPYRTLAKRAGISISTAISSVMSLTEKGLLSRWLCTLHNRKQTNRYKVLLRAGMTDFFCIPVRLIGTISPNALLLFACLSARTNRFGDCRISERQLAKETGLSRGTVRKHSAFLASCGALIRQARFYAGKRLTNARRCFSFSLFSRVADRSLDRGWYNFYTTTSEQTRVFPKQKGVEKSLFCMLHQIGENARRAVKEAASRLANRIRGRSGSRAADESNVGKRFIFSFLLLKKGNLKNKFFRREVLRLRSRSDFYFGYAETAQNFRAARKERTKHERRTDEP